jgi:hypothetical protein
MDLFNKSDSIVNRDAVCHPVKRLELAFKFGLKFPVGGSVPVLFISMMPVFRLVGSRHIYTTSFPGSLLLSFGRSWVRGWYLHTNTTSVNDRQTFTKSQILMTFFVTSCQLAFSYSSNIGEQDYICLQSWFWLYCRKFDFLIKILSFTVLCWLKMQNFKFTFHKNKLLES